MLISGFTYVRNGLEFGYPFIEAITSALPACDEFIAVVGDSTDGTREAIEALNSPKIRIVDTVWDMNLRTGGKVFAMQSNAGLDAIRGEWGLHIQADEIMHEDDVHKIRSAVEKYRDRKDIDGFIFPYLHFWGGYNYIRTSRRVHRYEVRLFRNDKIIRSFRDSQGFRKYSSVENYERGEKGEKLSVLKIDVPIYHYSYVRPPQLMTKKDRFFGTFYHPEAQREQGNDQPGFHYEGIDRLEEFSGRHPAVMQPKVDAQSWTFRYDKSMARMKFRYKVLHAIEDVTGYRFFEYKNYKLLKS